MNMTGMMFGGEGPIMQGTWYNPHTGDAFTVRDSFFEDNQYVVTTTDGRMMSYDQIQNYIQSDMKLEDLKRMKIEKEQKRDVLPSEIENLIDESNDPYASYMIEEDSMIMNKPSATLGNLYTNNAVVYSAEPTGVIAQDAGKSMNEAIIEKALKTTTKPNFLINVEWNDYPTKQIEMLKDIMEIPENEIIDWYLDNIDMLDIAERVKNAIRTRILCDECTGLANQIKAIIDANESAVNDCCDPGFYVDNSNKLLNLDHNEVHVAGDITLATAAKKTTAKKTTKSVPKKQSKKTK